MAFTEEELKGKNVKELKEICKQLGAPVKAKKDDLVASILQTQVADDSNGAGLEEVDPDLQDAAAAAADDNAVAAAEQAAAAEGSLRKASIVFNLEKTASLEKKANIVGVKALSDAERAQLRAAKFGLKSNTAAAAAGSKAAAGPGPKAAAASTAQPTLAEEIKRLERGVKYGKATEADQKKLESLKKKLEAQQEKQRLALDKVELMDPDKLAAREKKFGKPLLASSAKKDIKDPDAMKRRAEKFGKPLAASSSGDDEARKKARMERFAKQS